MMIGIGDGLLALSISAPVVVAMLKYVKRNEKYIQPCSFLLDFQKDSRDADRIFREEVLQRLTRIEQAIKD